MKFRHELKHRLNPADCVEISQRLSVIMQTDAHAGKDGIYQVRSLYFDNIQDKALREKLDGVNQREKFRIRYYNEDPSFIQLEKKVKVSGLCGKRAEQISAEEAKRIAEGDSDWIREQSSRLLLFELFQKMKTQGLRPKTIVDYSRKAFIYPCGNVRVTLDSNIRSGLSGTDFLNPDCVTIPAGDPAIIMEVKWDEYLPDIIRAAVQIPSRQETSFSKYAACRIYN